MKSAHPYQVWVALLLGLLAWLLPCEERCMSAEIQADQRVVFFPTAARLAADGSHWLAPIHGWIFEPEANSLKREGLKTLIRKGLELERRAPATETFDARISLFLVDNKRGRRITLRLGEASYELPPSEPDGHFEGEVSVPMATAQQFARSGLLRFHAVTAADDHRRFEGTMHLIAAEGVSLISDIDDTVKVTEVKDRKQLIQNTFFQPFRAVEGMAARYRAWAQAGAALHFVSNSPWQLYEPLQTFTRQAGFPEATFDLRRFRLKDPETVRSLLADGGDAKRSALERLLNAYPRRRFVLIGDAGERDPEIYGAVARAFPKRVLRIFIRDVTGQRPDSPRWQEAWAGLPPDIGRVFQDPAELQIPGL